MSAKLSCEDEDAFRADLFVLWQSLVVEGYRSFFSVLAEQWPGRIALAAPAVFAELATQKVACAPFAPPFRPGDQSYPAFVLQTKSWHVQAVLFRGLGRALASFFKAPRGAAKTPKIFLCIAEPYSLTALFAWLMARATLGKDFIFVCYGAQNIVKNLRWPFRWIQTFLFRHAAAILCVGREQEDVVRTHGYRGLCVPFPLWFDSSRFRLPKDLSSSEKVVIAYAGALTDAKGVLDLLAACEQEADSWREHCVLRLAGAGPLFAALAEGCERLREKGFDAQLVGPLRGEQMAGFFAGVDILLVPSRTMPGWKEQFGRVIVEALACGSLVLGSDSGEIPRVIGDPRCIFREASRADLVRVLDHWLHELADPRRRAAQRLINAESAQRYADKTLAARFCDTLMQILAAQPPRASR